MTIYCATTNPGKLREFRAASGPDIQIEPLPNMRSVEAPEESGVTFEENAILKALYYGPLVPNDTDSPFLMAEDSGLEVDHLCGEPGVYSARFAGPHATDEENNQLLLHRMRHSTDRSGRYLCVIALVRRTELVNTFRGTVEGEITEKRRGSGGFGYDSLFFYPPFGMTFGEAPAERKAEVSHRAKALTLLFAHLRNAK